MRVGPEHGGVDDGVDATGDDAADGRDQVGRLDGMVGAQRDSPGARRRSYRRDGDDPAGRGELQHERADRADRAGDQQPVTSPDPGGGQCLIRRQRGQGQCGGRDEIDRARRWGDRELVEQGEFGMCARRVEDVAQPDDGLAWSEPPDAVPHRFADRSIGLTAPATTRTTT